MPTKKPKMQINPCITKLWAENFKAIKRQLKEHYGKEFKISSWDNFPKMGSSGFQVNKKGSVRGDESWAMITINHFHDDKIDPTLEIFTCNDNSTASVRRVKSSRNIPMKYLLSKKLRNAIVVFIKNCNTMQLKLIPGATTS